MLFNYLKIAIRSMFRQKAFSIVNILSLAIGLGAAILILMYIRFDLSFDRFHKNTDRIYRVSLIHQHKDQREYESEVFTAPLASAIKAEFPEIQNSTRLSTFRTYYMQTEDKNLKIGGIRHADTSFFDIFSFNVLNGNPSLMLAKPFSLVLTNETKDILFGEKEAMGKLVNLDDGATYLVTGIVEKPPENSHIQFNGLISFSSLYRQPGWYMGWNGGNQYTAYLKLAEGVDPETVEAKFPQFLWDHINADLETVGVKITAYLQPLKDIHLFYTDRNGLGIMKIVILAVIALLITAMACINFINLSIAKSISRAKEVGIRKVLGAGKPALIRQFLSESYVFTFLAFAVAILLVELLMPLFSGLMSIDRTWLSVLNPANILFIILFVAVVGFVAGSYPALYISALQPAQSLKGLFSKGKAKSGIRNVLVVIQFFIAVTLIICTIFINLQLKYVQSKELGFEKEQILVVPFSGNDEKAKCDLVKNAFTQVAAVSSITASSDVPVRGFTSNGYFPEGVKVPMMIHVVDVDSDFLNTYKIKLKEGRNFSEEMTTDKSAYLVNETLVKSLGWDNPIGKTIERNGKHEIIGVVQDFNYARLYDKIEPLIISHQPESGLFSDLSLKISSADISATMEQLESAWNKIIPEKPFEYYFLSDSFQHLYSAERRFQKIFLYFSVLTLAIAVFGLFSLASYSIQQRTKEIGIRKVLGASQTTIIRLLSKEFSLLVIIASVIAAPTALIVMRKLLDHFAYRIELYWWVFIIAGLAAFLVAFLTIGIKAIKAAAANPVESLRYE